MKVSETKAKKTYETDLVDWVFTHFLKLLSFNLHTRIL